MSSWPVSSPTVRAPGRPPFLVSPLVGSRPARLGRGTDLPPETHSGVPSVGPGRDARSDRASGTAPHPHPPIEILPAAARPASRQLVLNFDNADFAVVVHGRGPRLSAHDVWPGRPRQQGDRQTIGKISSARSFGPCCDYLDGNLLARGAPRQPPTDHSPEVAPQTPVKTCGPRKRPPATPGPPTRWSRRACRSSNINAPPSRGPLAVAPSSFQQGASHDGPPGNEPLMSADTAATSPLLAILKLVDVESRYRAPDHSLCTPTAAQALAQLLAQLFSGGRLGAWGDYP